MGDAVAVRKLNAGDLYRVGKIIRKVAPRLVALDFAGKTGETEKEKARRIGADALPVVLETCYDDAWEWLADLAGMSVEEFNAQPMDTPLQVVEQLVEQGDLPDFLGKARAMAEKLRL